MKSITIGRDASNQYVIHDNTGEVSRHHAVIKIHDNKKVFIQDISNNGTFVNGKKVPSHIDVPIQWGDNVNFAEVENLNWGKISSIVDANITTYTIGTKAGNTIVLYDHTGEISRNHAVIEVHKDGSIYLTDYSGNGTWVNGQKVHNRKVQVQKGDAVSFANVQSLNWESIEVKKKATSQFNAKWLAVPVAVVLLGLLGYAATQFIPSGEVDIYEKYKNSIGLVYQEYYFAVIEKNKKDTLVIIGEGGELEAYKSGFNVKNSNLPAMKSTGSSFFISEEGEIITNRHVSTPDKLDDKIRDYIETTMGEGLSIETGVYQQVDIVGLNKYVGFAQNDVEIDIDNIKKSLQEVEIIEEAHNPKIDLALMQLKTKKLPKGCTAIDIEKDVIRSKKEIKIGSDAVILGYPAGLGLGLNEEDKVLKASYNEGIVSKISNKYEIQYDIPSFNGASGSPVFDKKTGKLIAINYLKMTETQGFNFGIIATHIEELLD